MLDEDLKMQPIFCKMRKDLVPDSFQEYISTCCTQTARSILNGGKCIDAPKDLKSKAYNLEVLTGKIANLFHKLYLDGYLKWKN